MLFKRYLSFPYRVCPEIAESAVQVSIAAITDIQEPEVPTASRKFSQVVPAAASWAALSTKHAFCQPFWWHLVSYQCKALPFNFVVNY